MRRYADCMVACPDEEPYWQRYAALVGANCLIRIPHRRFGLRVFAQLVRFAKASSIDVIHSHGLGAGLYARPLALLTSRPAVHTFHGLIFHPNKLAWTAPRLAAEWLLGMCTSRFVTVSETEKRHLSRWLFPYKHRIHRIHNGTSAPPAHEFEPITPEERHRILWVGRLHEQKNPLQLVDIATQLKALRPQNDYCFDVVGDGPLRQEFLDRVSDPEARQVIRFHGQQPNTWPFYARANILLSTSRWEGLPTCLIEGMLKANVVIASNVCGNVDLVQHGRNGLLFGQDSPLDAARLISAILDDKRWAAEIGESARTFASEYFSPEAFTSKHLELYNSLLPN